MHDWIREFPGAVTVCDADGVVIEMNERSIATFAKDGGAALIGKNILDCHPPQARDKIERLLRERVPNAYTIEKDGRRKLIYQAPWFANGTFSGLVELSLEIPQRMSHFVRD